MTCHNPHIHFLTPQLVFSASLSPFLQSKWKWKGSKKILHNKKAKERRLAWRKGEDCCHKDLIMVCAYIIEFKEPYLSYKFVVHVVGYEEKVWGLHVRLRRKFYGIFIENFVEFLIKFGFYWNLHAIDFESWSRLS